MPVSSTHYAASSEQRATEEMTEMNQQGGSKRINKDNRSESTKTIGMPAHAPSFIKELGRQCHQSSVSTPD
jgi:hypothetical protein